MYDLAGNASDSGDDEQAGLLSEETGDSVKALIDLRWNALDPDEE